jgi:hypothetical protein
MAFCTVCGWNYDGAPRFCQQCGTPLAAGAAPAGPPAPPPAAPGYAADPYAATTAYPGGPPSGEPATWMSEEHDLWVGKSIDMITQGEISPNHYRLTTRSLFYSHGRIGSVENSVPLWAVRAVTVEQKLVDKARHVGDLIVQVEHDDWTTGVNRVRLEDIENPQAVRDLILKQARDESYNYERRNQTMFYQGRPPIPPR